jgi:Big-like domain-containing protein
MPHSTASAARSALILLLAGAMGCASDVLLPDPAGGSAGPVALTMFSGDPQTGTVGELLNPLIVKVLAGDQPARGRQVAFLITGDPAAGTITPDTATTDSEGKAVAHWTLGTVPGDYLVVARLVGDETATQVAEFRAAANAGSPETLSPASAQAQAGRRKQPVADAPVVRVVDRYGNPVPNVSVAWRVTAGQGELGAASTATDADGKATVAWTHRSPEAHRGHRGRHRFSCHLHRNRTVLRLAGPQRVAGLQQSPWSPFQVCFSVPLTARLRGSSRAYKLLDLPLDAHARVLPVRQDFLSRWKLGHSNYLGGFCDPGPFLGQPMRIDSCPTPK